MMALHVLQGRLSKELGNVPSIPDIVHHSLPTEQLQASTEFDTHILQYVKTCGS